MPHPTPEAALERLWALCTGADWTGWDPYDGLMVRRWPMTLFRRHRVTRLVLIQAMKRSPVNLRPLLGVPKLRNPKALALGLDAAASLAALPRWRERALEEARKLAQGLLAAAQPTGHGAGWGYPFDWQARAFWIPRDTPTVVCTGFVVRALDRALPLLPDRLREAAAQAIARAAAFVQHDLARTDQPVGFCWSYSPLDRSVVVNASLLGAETVARAARLTGDRTRLREAEPTVRWALSRQSEEGGWPYGEARHHGWEDAFHTGFNLLSLRAVRAAAAGLGEDPEPLVPASALRRALAHYRRSFFDPDGRPWYFRHTPWPIDAHAAAVAVLTLHAFGDLDPEAPRQAERVLDWTLEHMWDRRGFFVFQRHRSYAIRICYLRWCQAWIVRALAEHISVSAEASAAAAP